MARSDGRFPDQLRPLRITRHFSKYAEGAVLVECGDTRVVCTASVEDRTAAHLKGTGAGWVTAEYGMLPRSTHARTPREVSRGRPSGRTSEIQRLIGRSLRAVVELQSLGERTIWIDCDVIQADGGTRTASITGGFVALADALAGLRRQGLLLGPHPPLRDCVAAVSAGIVDGVPLLDLCYDEDVRAQVDLNLVMTGGGLYVEVQGTGEGGPFPADQLEALLRLGRRGIAALVEAQRAALGPELDLLLAPPPPVPPEAGSS